MQVQFYTDGGRLLGAAHTNHSGIAAISASENLGPGTAQELLAGYDAVLLGDDVHAPASAHRHPPLTSQADVISPKRAWAMM